MNEPEPTPQESPEDEQDPESTPEETTEEAPQVEPQPPAPDPLESIRAEFREGIKGVTDLINARIPEAKKQEEPKPTEEQEPKTHGTQKEKRGIRLRRKKQ